MHMLSPGRLRGPDYGRATPALRRGRLRTLALRRSGVVDWAHPRANLHGCFPCPRCGEVLYRAAYRYARHGVGGMEIRCDACGDRRPVRRWIERGSSSSSVPLRPEYPALFACSTVMKRLPKWARTAEPGEVFIFEEVGPCGGSD